jgi:hypothetical protein
MDFMKYRVKVMEGFKDGNVLEGRFLKPGEILVLSESDVTKITNSGGVLEILQEMIPNPLKQEAPEIRELKLAQLAQEVEDEIAKEGEISQAEETTYREEVDEKKVVVPAKRKAGRPKKNAS